MVVGVVVWGVGWWDVCGGVWWCRVWGGGVGWWDVCGGVGCGVEWWWGVWGVGWSEVWDGRMCGGMVVGWCMCNMNVPLLPTHTLLPLSILLSPPLPHLQHTL